LRGLVAAAVTTVFLAVSLSSCNLAPAPFDDPVGGGTQCIPLAGADVVTDGMDMFQNHGTRTAVIDKLALRRPEGLVLDRAWIVPTDAQLYGAAYGYPPPHRFSVVGWRWDRRQLANGAAVPPLSSGQYLRMNVVIVVRLAAGFKRGRTAGIDMWYHVGLSHYYRRFLTALVADRVRC
jgi:hypothetical protein